MSTSHQDETKEVGAIRVIIADDHKLMREGTRELLSRHRDIEVVGEAEDGEKAIRLAQELRPDVAIVDIAMPRVNGIEVTRAIKRSCPGTTVLILTMYDDDQYVFSLLEAGAAGYLLKDVSSVDLVKAVRDVRQGEAVLHPTIARKVLARFLHPTPKERTQEGNVLTDREKEVLQLAAQGLTNKEIGQKLGLSMRTAQAHLSHSFAKLGVASRTEAIVYGLRQGWLHLEDQR